MTLVPGWMWQTMHWLVGMPAANWCSIGWPGSFLGDRRVGFWKLRPRLPNVGVRAGVDRRAVVGVDHVAGGAAARAIVAGVVVGAQEVERRVEEPRLAAGRSKTGSVRFWVPRPRSLRPARGLPGSSNGSGMPISCGSRPPRSKIRRTLPGCEASKRGSGSRNGTTPLTLDLPLASAAGRSGAAAARRSCCSSRRSAPALNGHRAVVVEGRAPEHRAVGHHALAALEHLARRGSSPCRS